METPPPNSPNFSHLLSHAFPSVMQPPASNVIFEEEFHFVKTEGETQHRRQYTLTAHYHRDSSTLALEVRDGQTVETEEEETPARGHTAVAHRAVHCTHREAFVEILAACDQIEAEAEELGFLPDPLPDRVG